MTQRNTHVENVTHAEAMEETIYAGITAAVQRQLERNNADMLKHMEERSKETIEDAIKRALEEQQYATSVRTQQKKVPELKSKGHQIRYEVNAEILEKIETAITAIDRKELDIAKTTLKSGKKLIS